jgi:hypothetical protein
VAKTCARFIGQSKTAATADGRRNRRGYLVVIKLPNQFGVDSSMRGICWLASVVLLLTLPSEAIAKKVCVFPIGGQSNAVGSSERPGPLVPYPVWVYVPNAPTPWRYANDPLPGGGTGSPWPAYGSEFYHQTGVTVLFVQTSMNGGYQTDVGRNINNPPLSESWDVSGTRVPNAFALTDAALAWTTSIGLDAKVCGVLWFQGESEANGISWNPTVVTKAIYKTALQTMIGRFRDKYSPTLPFYIFRTGAPKAGSPPSMTAANGYAAVREAQEETAAELPATLIATRRALTHAVRSMLVDDIHLNQAANDELGLDAAKRVAASGLWNRW